MNHLQLPNGLQTGYIQRVRVTIRKHRIIPQLLQEHDRDVDGLLTIALRDYLLSNDDGNIASNMPWLDFPDGGQWMLTGNCNLEWLYSGDEAEPRLRWRVTMAYLNPEQVMPKTGHDRFKGRGLKDLVNAEGLPVVDQFRWLELPDAIFQQALRAGWLPFRMSTEEQGREVVLCKPGLQLAFELCNANYLAGVANVEASIAKWRRTHD